jgi:acyl carrier protein
VQSLQLVGGFEEEFDIEMEEDKALAVQTVGDAVAFIAQHVG